MLALGLRCLLGTLLLWVVLGSCAVVRTDAALAWAAALLPLAGLPLLIGSQCAWAAWACRRDAERPPWRAWVRAWWAECRWALRLFGWLQPFRAGACPDRVIATPGRRGVVLVHGFGCNRALWTLWLQDLHRAGRCHVALNLEPPWGPIERHVQALGAAVQQVRAATGLSPLVICHSMGGLVARAWMCATDAAHEQAHGVVTLGTPHGGSLLAGADLLGLARQMHPGHAWLQASEEALPRACRARFTCWYAVCDNIVFPASRACLPGARHLHAGRRAHVEMVFDPMLRQQTLAMLDEPASWGDCVPEGDKVRECRRPLGLDSPTN